jgi:hypothetical protein
MTLNKASEILERLVSETTKKSEITVYKKFLQILNKLKLREFSKDEIQSIETALENLNLESNTENRKKYVKKSLSKFETYLTDTFSLTSKGYYANRYGALGLSFGLLFGVAILSNLERSLGISLGLIGGMVVGSIIGRNKDAQAKAAGNML